MLSYLTVPVMCRAVVSVHPIRLSCAVSRVHLERLATVRNRVVESHIDEEIAQNAQDSFPLGGGQPRPFKPINLILVSPDPLTDHRSVCVTPGIYDCGYDYAHTPLGRW